MKFDRDCGVVMLVAAITASVACQAQRGKGASDTPLEGPGSSLVSVKIEFDPSVLTLDEITVNGILNSVRVGGRAAEQVLGLSPAEARTTAIIGLSPATGEIFRSGDFLGTISVQIHRAEMKPSAPQLARLVCKLLEEELCVLHDRKLERARNEVERTKTAAEAAEQRVDAILDLQSKLRLESGLLEMTRDAALKILHDLEERQQDLEMQLIAANARERAIATQIAAIAKAAEGRAKNDPVAAELEKVVAVREMELQRITKLVESGGASSGDSNRAVEALALARAELVKSRAAATQSAGGDLLGKLNGDLVHITIESAEAQARLGVVRGRLDDLRKRKLLELVERYEREVERRLAPARQEAQTAAVEYQRLKNQLATTRRPEVIVLGP